MSLFSTDLSLVLCLGAATLPLLIFCAASPVQSQPEADSKALVARMDAARGAKATPASLTIEGTLEVSFTGVPAEGSVLKGTFREVHAGDRGRTEVDLGENGVILSGITEDLVWEVDPVAGAKVVAGVHAQTSRRWFALLRGVSPGTLYKSIVRAGTQKLDEREHVLLRMTPAEGKPDTWYVDPATGLVARIDTVTPASDGAQAVWGMDAEVETQLLLGDWRKVDGVMYAHRRAVKMGPATFTFTIAKIAAGGKPDPKAFTPPEAVLKIKAAGPASQPAIGGGYQVVEREAQPVVSIRLRCKPEAISATLAVAFPEICQHLNAIGARMGGLPFSRYHAVGETEVDVEMGIPVTRPITEKGRIKNSELPAGRVVTGWHMGPYEKLTGAHAALKEYAQSQKLQVQGGPWEIYWTDPGMVPDPARWRTQLFLPVAR